MVDSHLYHRKDQSTLITENIKLLAQNKNPLDMKGNEYPHLTFTIDDENTLDSLLDALLANDSFKGSLKIESLKFNDVLGLKIAQIIGNNNLTELEICNRNSPFSDRVSLHVGNALETNTSLKSLKIFLNVGNLSPVHLTKFLRNSSSSLEKLSYLKITSDLFEQFTQFLNKKSKLSELGFYYEPLRQVNLLYESEISDDVKSKLADAIQNSSNVIDVKIIPLEEKFAEVINEKLTRDIYNIEQTLKFSCDIVKKELTEQINIDQIFEEQNKRMSSIIETVDQEIGKQEKNSIISVRSYLERAIGELLNQALYDLEIQRDRFPEKKELFTAKGSIRYVAQYLIEKKS